MAFFWALIWIAAYRKQALMWGIMLANAIPNHNLCARVPAFVHWYNDICLNMRPDWLPITIDLIAEL